MSTLKSRRNAKRQLKEESSSEISISDPEQIHSDGDSQARSDDGKFKDYKEVPIGFKDAKSDKSGSEDSSFDGAPEEEYDVCEIEQLQQEPEPQNKVWSQYRSQGIEQHNSVSH